jgi:arylsulfatase A
MQAGLYIRFLMFLLFAGTVSSACNIPKQYNIVSILVDDWGWTDARCYGSDLYETLHIDQLAAEGVRFTNAYAACTVCSPTRAALMTGKYPARLHVTDWIPGYKAPYAKLKKPDWTMYLSPDETILPEALKEKNYRSIHIGKWHLGHDEKYYPQNQGFDTNIAGYFKGQPPSYFYPYTRNDGPPIPYLEGGKAGEYLTDREAEEACRFIRENRESPFYINLAHYAVHTPLQAKEAYIEEYREKIQEGMQHSNAVYAAMIRSVDESLGKIRKTLDEEGIADKTVILITGDNGGLTLYDITDNTPLRGGKGSAYEGGVRVPLIAYIPGITKAGSICKEAVLTIDIYPTFLELAGIRGHLPHSGDVDGLSLVPLAKDPEKQLNRQAVYWHFPHYHPGGATPYSAVRMGDYKLIEFFEDGRLELYNLKKDIGEKDELSSSHPEKVQELFGHLKSWRDQVDAQIPARNEAFNIKKVKPWLKNIYENEKCYD